MAPLAMIHHRLRSVIAQRLASIGTRRTHSQALPERWEGLSYKQHGPPQDVLKLEGVSDSLRKLQNHGFIAVEMLAAPVNPSDINQIEGKYPIKPPLPAFGGNEGAGRVLEVGREVKGIKEGDWVVPLRAGQQTWRQFASFEARDWHVIPSSLPLVDAATLSVNPVTALRMLEEFQEVRPGDSVVQNGANSAVGRVVIQVARARGVHTVNVVRDRPDLPALEKELAGLGADVVTTEERLKGDLAASGLPRPALGLNCIGGSSSAALAKALAAGGTLVSYGGMSMKPVTIPTSLFIFKGIQARGFWLSGDDAEPGARALKAAAIDKVVDLVQQGQLRTGGNLLPFRSFAEALQATGTKQILTFQDNSNGPV